MGRTEKINLNQKEQLAAVGKALSSELRIQILEELEEQAYNVNEIAELLQIPASSAAMHVRVLEEAGLIETELRAAVVGSMKVCKKTVTEVLLDLRPEGMRMQSEFTCRLETMWIIAWCRPVEWYRRKGI